MLPNWDEIIEKMGEVKEDITMQQFLDRFYPKESNASLNEQLTNYVEGFDVADVSKVSVRALYTEWSHEEETNYRIPAGYASLISFLENQLSAAGVEIHRDHAINKIDWKDAAITVHATSGAEYNCDKLAITVPLAQLQHSNNPGFMSFEPAIPSYTSAISNIGVGDIVKLVIEFTQILWPADAGFIFSTEQIPTWWTALPVKTPLLTGWAGGPRASRLASHSDDELINIGYRSLVNILGFPEDELRNKTRGVVVFNWKNFSYANGAYSYATPHTNAARQVLKTPVDERIYFCGEGLYEGTSPGTVEAAIVQAKTTAQQIRKSL